MFFGLGLGVPPRFLLLNSKSCDIVSLITHYPLHVTSLSLSMLCHRSGKEVAGRPLASGSESGGVGVHEIVSTCD